MKDRIRECLQLSNRLNDTDIKVFDLCEELNLDRNELGTWDCETKFPSTPQLIAISKKVNSSMEYLLGLNNKEYETVTVNFSRVFDPDKAFTRYAYYLWKSHNEVWVSYMLLRDTMYKHPFERDFDWAVLFQNLVSAVCEAGKIILLYKIDNPCLKKARQVFLDQDEIKKKYDSFAECWEKHKAFILGTRNRIAHNDDEEKNESLSFLKNTKLQVLTKELYFDFVDPVFFDYLITEYRLSFQNKENEKNSNNNVKNAKTNNTSATTHKTDKELLYESVKVFFKDVTDKLIPLLEEMVAFYFHEYTTKRQNSITANNKKIPQFKYTQQPKPKKYTDSEKNIIKAIREQPEAKNEVEELLGIKPPKNTSNQVFMLPVFESASAGLGSLANDDAVDYKPYALKGEYEKKLHMFIKVKGDSMQPKIQDGDYILVRKQEGFENGSLVVLTDKDDADYNYKGFVKKVIKIEKENEEENEVHIISLNDEYEEVVLKGKQAENLTTVGIVKEIIHQP